MSGQISTSNASHVAPSVLQRLALHLARPVDADTQARAVLHVVDWLGQSVYATTQPAAAGFMAARMAFGAAPSVPKCRSICGREAASGEASQVLMLNAAVGNILEMDDLHRTSILHPGPIIVPAAIAVAESIGASGAELLRAIVRGYEATIRIGRALGTSHYRFFHNTSTCGSFGAAAAAASLLGLDVERTVWALANAGSRTGGLWQMRHEACETKSLHNALAAQSGVEAAQLALHGVRGPSRFLEGPQGLFAAMTDGADANDVLRAPLDSWLIHEVSFKPWPACRHAHPCIDAALAARSALEAAGHRVDAITSIDIGTYRSAIDFCDKPNPQTTLEAKFSLQHCVAAVLAHGRPEMQHFEAASLADPALARWRSIVRVSERVEMSAAFPTHYAASVAFGLRDGATIAHTQADAWGDPEWPLAPDDVMSKARLLLASVGIRDDSRIASILDSTRALQQSSDCRNWTAQWPSANELTAGSGHANAVRRAA
ncbi:MAG: MmgE/PrpD family protein [Burkholderiales bacterium]|jgi:2-methylcitrate dehydratase PrpD|nr:MmgE/PrpD family protein [Nitrosomonadaceae bacterium]